MAFHNLEHHRFRVYEMIIRRQSTSEFPYQDLTKKDEWN
jgi:hypothetical protein